MQSPIDRAYQDLANAIVMQAVTDYRKALKGKGYSGKSHDRVIRETERFFRSQYFEILTKVDGEYLIEKLKGENSKK